MNIVKEKKVLIIDMEYQANSIEDRNYCFEYMDKMYGKLKWICKRSGPYRKDKGLVVAHVEID